MKKLKIIFLAYCIASISVGYAQNYFVTTWNTEAGNHGNTTIELPIIEGAYDVDVNGDGDFDDGVDLTNQIEKITIYFGSAGMHTIKVRPNPTNNTSKQLRISHVESGGVRGTPLKLTSIDKWGDIVWTSMASAFRDCSNMTLADNAGVPDLSMVTDMSHAFDDASSFTGNLSSWDVSSVTDMSYAFDDASSFTGNLSSWDVSSVTNMRSMFKHANSFTSDLSSWDVSNVTSMSGTFSDATSFNKDLSSWNVSNVTSMSYMFVSATSFNSDLSSWDVSNVSVCSGRLEVLPALIAI